MKSKLFLLLLLAVPCFAQLSVTQIGSANSGGTAASVTLSGITIIAGTAVIVSIGIDNFSTALANSSVTDNLSDTYTKVAYATAQGGAAACGFWYLKNAPSGITSVTVSTSPNDFLILHVYTVTNADTISPLDSHNEGGTTASSSSGTISDTTSATNTVVFGDFSGLSTSTWSAGSGWTAGFQNDSVSVLAITLDDVYQIESSSGTFSPNGTWSPNQASGYSAAAIAIKASSGGTTPPGLKSKKLQQLSAWTWPSYCAAITAPDCDGFSDNPSFVAFVCLFPDNSCASSMVVPAIGQTNPVNAAASSGSGSCLFGANLGGVPVTSSQFGSIDTTSFAYSCAP